ncbi:Protoglobin-domain-containing protein [Xylaria sp. CBS 124048]|nr:Protoglobin-domain-containing protein [Xylaria sp. CBS 124048]
MNPSLPRNTRHIDRRELYTNLETRIQYLHSFLDFSSQALISGSKYIKSLIPALVNIVYQKLLQYDITARAFQTRSTSHQGPAVPVDDDDDAHASKTTTTTPTPTLVVDGGESPIIQHRKTFLRAYLNKLCSDPSTMEFWYYLDKVGMMHVGRGREHPLHIEYIHIGVCLSFIQDTLTEALLSHPRLKMERKVALVKALGKVIWIQNDLFAKWCKYHGLRPKRHHHVRDGDEFAHEVEAPKIEKEGYLNGKMVLNDVGEDATGSSVTGGCPFSGLAKGEGGETEEPTGL